VPRGRGETVTGSPAAAYGYDADSLVASAGSLTIERDAWCPALPTLHRARCYVRSFLRRRSLASVYRVR